MSKMNTVLPQLAVDTEFRDAEFVVPLSQRNIQSDCKDAPVGVKKQDIQGENVENRFRKTSKRERTGRNASQTIVVWKGESTISMGWNDARAKHNGRKSQ